MPLRQTSGTDHSGHRPSHLNALAKAARAGAKKLLPGKWVREIQQYRTYEKSERSLYLRTRLLNEFSFRGSSLPMKPTSILFVCFGNIIRSPMCEALMKRLQENAAGLEFKVSSAGLNAIPGRPAHSWAVDAAQSFNVSLEGHRARLLSEEMVNDADLILVMDYQNQVQILSRYPKVQKKARLLGCYSAASALSTVEIQDPFYLGRQETQHCYRVLNDCVQNLALAIREQGSGATVQHSK
jgi:protein-tyrosine-phosphatase